MKAKYYGTHSTSALTTGVFTYAIPVSVKLLTMLFQKEFPGMQFSKADARCLLYYMEREEQELRLDVIQLQLYRTFTGGDGSIASAMELIELVIFCADCNYDLQVAERAKRSPNKKRLCRLKKDNDRFDRLVERMSE